MTGLVSRSLRPQPNLDLSWDTRYPNGDKPQVQKSTLDIDLAAFTAAQINLLSRPQNTAISINYRQFLTGTSAASAFLQVNTISGVQGAWGFDSPTDSLLTNATLTAGSGALQVVASDGVNSVAFSVQQWSILAPVQQTQKRFQGSHMGASGGIMSGTRTFEAFQPEINDMCKDSWITGYRQFVTWGHMDMGYANFTASVGGASSGTLTGAPQNGDQVYWGRFSNGEYRSITVSGTAATWAGVLKSGSVTQVHLYNLAQVDRVVNYLATNFSTPKWYVMAVLVMSFSGGYRKSTDYSILPKFIATNSLYGASPDGSTFGWWSGQIYTAWNSGTAYAVNAKVSFGTRNWIANAASTNVQPSIVAGNPWTAQSTPYSAALYRTAVAQEYANLGTALGAKYDGVANFYAILDQENSAVVGPATRFPPADGSYSDTNYYNALTTVIYPAWLAAFPHVNVVGENSFMFGPTAAQNLMNWMATHSMAAGSADTVGLAYTQTGTHSLGGNWGLAAYAGQQVSGSTATVSDRRGFMACMMDVEGPDISPVVRTVLGTTPKDIIDFANQILKINNLFWCYLPAGKGADATHPQLKWADVTAVLKVNPLTTTAYPGNYP